MNARWALFVAMAPLALAVAAAAEPLRVMIDPGHGGSNPGATAIEPGRHEKQVTLAIARRVRDTLAARGVVAEMTRDRDRTLTLRQRVVAANRAGADLFVSIHANASPARNQRGFETYLLSAAGVEVDGRALRSDGGVKRRGVEPDISLVLDDVERGAAQWESADLAASIQRQLRRVRGRQYDRGVRQDIHHVLLGATMPAVLVEVGFIDHPSEGRELLTERAQADIAAAIAHGIAQQLGVEGDQETVPRAVPDSPASDARGPHGHADE